MLSGLSTKKLSIGSLEVGLMDEELMYIPHWIEKGNEVVHNGTNRVVKDTYVVDNPEPYWQERGFKILLIVFEDGTQVHGVQGIEPVGGRKRRKKK